MSDLAKLIVKLEAQTAQYHAELEKANDRLAAYQRQTNQRLASMQKGWASFGASVKRFVGVAAIGVALRRVLTETSEAQDALAQLEAVVKSTGGAAGFTVPQLQKMAEQFQRTTTFTDDAVVGMQAVLLQFTRLSGPEFEAAQGAILDLATRLGKDLPSAAILVGKALNDPIRGMTALSKAGVQFTAQQTDQIKALTKAGKLAEAQGIILGELEKRFGGAAEAARGTFGGAIKGLQNAFFDLFEVSTTGSSKAVESLNNLSAVLSDPGVKKAADTLLSGLITSLAWIIDNASKVAGGIAVIFGAAGDRIEEINDEIEFLQENLKTGAVVFGDAFGQKGLVSFLSPEEIRAQIKALGEEQQKLLDVGKAGHAAADGLTAAGAAASGSHPGDPEALEAIQKVIDGLRTQVATFGKADAAVMRYRITQGDLADEFEAAGDQAGALGEELVGLAGRLDRLQEAAARAKEIEQARAVFADMVADLQQSVATFGAGEVAVMRYRLEHGKLAEQLALLGPNADAAREEILRLTAALEAKKDADEKAKEAAQAHDALIEEGKRVYEETRTATEKYAAEIIHLKDLMREGVIDADTFNRAVTKVTKEWQDAQKEANKFAEEATRNVQDILGSWLEDLALSGKLSFDSLLADFNTMLIKMAAQAVAADIAGKLFGSGGVGSGGGLLSGALGKIGGFIGGLFGGGSTVAAYGANVRGMQPVRVGEQGRAEWFFPGMDGRIVPETAMAGGDMTVNQRFTVVAPQGSISRATEQQIAAAAQRGLAMAAARNN